MCAGVFFLSGAVYMGFQFYKAIELPELTARTRELKFRVENFDSLTTSMGRWIDTLEVIIQRGIMPPVITTPIKKI